MSKIGKKPIIIPSGVSVEIRGGLVVVKGPKGELSKHLPEAINVSAADSSLKIELSDKKLEGDKKSNALWGLYRSILSNMVKGVVDGFEKVLEFQGIGYKALVNGKNLELELGFSHPVEIIAPEEITFSVEKNVIRVTGLDKELVGRVAAEIKSHRKPEPYKGSGIRYQNEIIKKKAGKKAVAAG